MGSELKTPRLDTDVQSEAKQAGSGGLRGQRDRANNNLSEGTALGRTRLEPEFKLRQSSSRTYSLSYSPRGFLPIFCEIGIMAALFTE